MAPAHPHPAAVNDARDVGVALLSAATSPLPAALGGVQIDFATYGTFGISAGGYMAANAARQLAAVDGIAPQTVQISIVPMAKPNGGTSSMAKFFYKKDWGGAANAYAWSVLLPGDDGSIAATWQASLLVDPPAEIVAKLPRAYVQINTQDVLRDEGELYAQKLEAMGKLIKMEEFNTGHIGTVPGKLSEGGPGADAFARALATLQQELYKEAR